MDNHWKFISNGDCPYGGKCIDPGYPSDCEVNMTCFPFNCKEEKTQFDNLPDRYKLVLTVNHIIYDPKTYETIGTQIKEEEVFFKTPNQVKFFLRDARRWIDSSIHVLDDNSKLYIKMCEAKDFNLL